nr:hypothetical protein [uncultured bacterium]
MQAAARRLRGRHAGFDVPAPASCRSNLITCNFGCERPLSRESRGKVVVGSGDWTGGDQTRDVAELSHLDLDETCLSKSAARTRPPSAAQICHSESTSE